MDLLFRFKEQLKSLHLSDQNLKFLIAVSGGVDSIVLCDLCYRSGFDFTIAHCNFQLRGADADADEHFVSSYGMKIRRTVLAKRFETLSYANEKGVSIQVAARQLRYAWFNELLNSDRGLSYIITAHHADDGIETLLMNFFKGTGISGLCGIPTFAGKENKIVRPLLFARKQELLQHADDNKLKFRQDASNAETKYTRNFFRLEILPALQKIYPEVDENLLNNIKRFQGAYSIYRQGVDALKKKLLQAHGADFRVPVLLLQKATAPGTILFEMIKQFNFRPAQVEGVLRLMDSASGRYIDSPTHRIIRYQRWLVITALTSPDTDHRIIEEGSGLISLGDQSLKINLLTAVPVIEKVNQIALIDRRKITFPLIVRRWKKGDYFYPLGMRKKKKLARFFGDLKLSQKEKNNVWVVETLGKILWVAGLRIDDRFKITEATKGAIRFELLPPK